MGLWGNSNTVESRPKFLPIDSNAAGSTGAREHAIVVGGGWGLSPGLAASGNDNKDAQPEVLVCIRNLAEVFGSATPISIGFSEGAVADTGTFDITLAEDTTTEGTETINARIYTDSGRTNKVATTDNITVADTSLGAILGGAVFHASGWNNTESYSWTVPDGVTSISVVCVGGGGAGETNHDGASGGGGGLAYKNGLAVTPGDTINVYVGGGGFSAGWGQTNPDSGQSSYITYNGTNYAVAGGGEGAQGSAGDGWYSNSNSFPNTNSDGGGQGGSGYHQGGSRQSGIVGFYIH